MNTLPTLPATASAVNPTGFDVPLSVIRDIAAGAENSTAPVACWGRTDFSRLAAQAVWEFAQRTGACSAEESAATVIQDLLTSLMHLCDQEGITSDLVEFPSEDSVATAIPGLLTDLMHLCDQEGITSERFAFRDLVSRAEAHYVAELEEGV